MERCCLLAPGKTKFRFRNKLLSLDATVIDLCLSLFDWAKFRQTKGAIKLHLLLDHDGYLPTFAQITEGSVHEVKIAQKLRFPTGSIVVVDRGFTDFSLFGGIVPILVETKRAPDLHWGCAENMYPHKKGAHDGEAIRRQRRSQG